MDDIESAKTIFASLQSDGLDRWPRKLASHERVPAEEIESHEQLTEPAKGS